MQKYFYSVAYFRTDIEKFNFVDKNYEIISEKKKRLQLKWLMIKLF